MGKRKWSGGVDVRGCKWRKWRKWKVAQVAQVESGANGASGASGEGGAWSEVSIPFKVSFPPATFGGVTDERLTIPHLYHYD